MLETIAVLRAPIHVYRALNTSNPYSGRFGGLVGLKGYCTVFQHALKLLEITGTDLR